MREVQLLCPCLSLLWICQHSSVPFSVGEEVRKSVIVIRTCENYFS